jgi:hypothetical protein
LFVALDSAHASNDLDLIPVWIVDVEGLHRQKRVLTTSHSDAKLAKSISLCLQLISRNLETDVMDVTLQLSRGSSVNFRWSRNEHDLMWHTFTFFADSQKRRREAIRRNHRHAQGVSIELQRFLEILNE